MRNGCASGLVDVAMWIHRDGEARLVGQQHFTRTVSGALFVSLCAPRAFREADDIAGLEHVLALGMAERRPAREDDRPLLAAVLVVVRANALPLA